MHLRADAVADVLVDDAVDPAVALGRGLDAGLDGVTDRIQPAADLHGGDAGVEARLGGVDERDVLGTTGLAAADDRGERGVAVPALDLGAAVDRDDVAGLEHPRGPGCRGRPRR